MPETAEEEGADGRSRQGRTKKSIWIDKDMPLTRSKHHVDASRRLVTGKDVVKSMSSFSVR